MLLINVVQHFSIPLVVFDPLPVAASKNVTDFAAALNGANVTMDTLEFTNGTFFLGDPDLGSKLFIRICSKELSEIILSGASGGTLRKVVVTGTRNRQICVRFLSSVPASLPRKNCCI